MSQTAQRTRFNKLSLKKNKLKLDSEPNKPNKSSDLIILDESDETLDCLKLSLVNKKIFSPIVINDSSEMSFEEKTPLVTVEQKSPSKIGNVSFNGSKMDTSVTKIQEQPSFGGWSPAQNIMCATPRNLTIPSTPRDVANVSSEQCTIKTIQKSQKNLLDELYGEVWKSIPTLFKRKSQEKDENFEAVTKKLKFDDESPKKTQNLDDSLKKSDNESGKVNIRHILAENKKLYLTGSDAKHKVAKYDDTEKKSKKKLYTEKVSSTPDPIKLSIKPRIRREVNTTTKKLKNKTVTELVEIMKDKYHVGTKSDQGFDEMNGESIKKSNAKRKAYKFDDLCENVRSVTASPTVVKRLSFVGSLADNVPSWRCHVAALQFRDKFKSERDRLTRRLFEEFNKSVFGDGLDHDMIVEWDSKLRSTAGTTTNRLIKNSQGEKIRSSSIKLSTKVLDTCQRLRDTLIHEMCHAATWILDEELRAGHGPLWSKWARRALQVFPELGEISRCHDLEIHYKYSYKCTKCGYTIKRHSKSLDVAKKCCGYCRGSFQLIVNRKNKDGVVVSTPSRGGEANRFAMFVKENYAGVKSGRTHAEAMKSLAEKFAESKKVSGT